MKNGNCLIEIEESVSFIFNFLKKKKLLKKNFKQFLDYILKITEAETVALDNSFFHPFIPTNFDLKDILRRADKKTVISYNGYSVFTYQFKHPVQFKRIFIFKKKRFTKKEVEFFKSVFSFWDFINFERAQKEKLKKHVYVDILTGVYNRYFLENVIPRELKKVERYKQPLSVIFIDIDNFKYINDYYGHNKGDMVLKIIGNIFKKNIRKTDLPIRYGGDEFLIFLPFTSEKDAVKIAEKLKSIISYSCKKKLNIDVTVSAGVLEVREQENLKSILNKLDILLYKAKATGKDKIIA